MGVVGSISGEALNEASTWQRGPGPGEDPPSAPQRVHAGSWVPVPPHGPAGTGDQLQTNPQVAPGAFLQQEGTGKPQDLPLPPVEEQIMRVEVHVTLLTDLQEGTGSRAASLKQPVPLASLSRLALPERRIRLYGTILILRQMAQRIWGTSRSSANLSVPSQPARCRI